LEHHPTSFKIDQTVCRGARTIPYWTQSTYSIKNCLYFITVSMILPSI
jgi:hypothetical protein